MSSRGKKQHEADAAAKARFGTFAGVFTPNVLTILGIIFFLRTGWVVGEAGLLGALIIVLIANFISLFTGLSLASVSTSMDVKVGGTYYIISRSLGLEIGGAIGIPLYLSQAISVAFYIIGFVEAFVSTFPGYDPQILASLIVLFFGLLAYIGADFILRIQFGILALLGLALISLFTGSWGETVAVNWMPSAAAEVPFWSVFAVFFPAVTGIAIGVSMSGDLKEPTKSIKNGTLASIGVTAIIYIGATIWLARHATPVELVNNNMIMEKIARWPIFILLGVWAATLSSALGSVLAAPRTLQALAYDRVVPKSFGSQLGSKTEPRMAVLITTAIALSVVWMGSLNFVATIITMFFLNTYGMINLTAGIERMVGNPSYRPQFKVPGAISILGAVGCYAAMFLIHWVATIVAIIISFGVFFLLEHRSLQRTWGDIRSGFWYAVTRYGLLNLQKKPMRAKNWRPNIVVFTGQPHNREHLVEVSEWLSMGRGVVTFFQLIVGEVEEVSTSELKEAAEYHIQKYIRERKMTAFAESEVVPDFYHGALGVVQAHGIGGFIPNTILLGWSDKSENFASQMKLLRGIVHLRKSVVFLHYDEERGYGDYRTIDIWWGGLGKNAEFMLLLGHIITRHQQWHRSKIRVIRVIDKIEGKPQAEQNIRSILSKARVEAEPVIIARSEYDHLTLSDIIHAQSNHTDLTLLGLKYPAENELQTYGQQLNKLVRSVGSVLIVRSAQVEDFLEKEEFRD